MRNFSQGIVKASVCVASYRVGNFTAAPREGRQVHEVVAGALTVAEDVSGMPGVGRPVAEGGLGFDYRLAMGLPDFWVRLLKSRRDEQWSMTVRTDPPLPTPSPWPCPPLRQLPPPPLPPTPLSSRSARPPSPQMRVAKRTLARCEVLALESRWKQSAGMALQRSPPCPQLEAPLSLGALSLEACRSDNICYLG